MTGDECVAVCSDLRYGRELQTIATDFPKVHTIRVFKGHAFYFVLGFRDEPLPLGGSAWPCNRHSDGKGLKQLFPLEGCEPTQNQNPGEAED